MDSFQSEEVHVEEACRPVLVYQQGSEVKTGFGKSVELSMVSFMDRS